MYKLIFMSVLFCWSVMGQESTENLPGLNPPLWGKLLRPKRVKPVVEGAFSVGLIMVNFPDTNTPKPQSIKRNLLRNGPKTVKEYFKEYSQGITWPECFIIGEDAFPKNVYQAPKPKGYYCKFDHWTNPLGYKSMEEGKKRVAELKKLAFRHVAGFKVPKGLPDNRGRAHIHCVVYSANFKPHSELGKSVGPAYGNRKHPWDEKKKIYELYKPQIAWGDPLWPNSSIQVQSSSSGSTMCHELGHVLGAPDFYHATEPYDGVPGNPTGGSDYGPTGPGYCRYIYNAFLTEKNYPTITKSGRYTLYPRKLNPAGDKAIGAFVMSSHSHYMYVIEYVRDEQDKTPLGMAGRSGLIVQVINVTKNDPYHGGPDLCYAYRKNDPWFRGEGKVAVFSKNNDSEFSIKTEPSSRLPNLTDGGLSIKIIEESAESITFDITVAQNQIRGNEYKYSTLPKISLVKVGETLPTSFAAECNVLFRGEPLLTDYGFCWDTRPRPTLRLRSNNYFSLYHRDRYTGRALNLRPKMKYYVRAYVRNKNGVTYSAEEMEVTLPDKALHPTLKEKYSKVAEEDEIKRVDSLLDDLFSGNSYLNNFYWNRRDSSGEGSIVAGTALITLMKLVTYYREPFKVKPVKSKKKKRRSTNNPFEVRMDYTRIHTNPSKSRPLFRMVELDKLRSVCDQISRATNMTAREFPENFAEDFTEAFDLENPVRSNSGPVEKLTVENLKKILPRIQYSLINSEPVVVVQEPKLSTPDQYGLSWIIIDGFDEKGRLHIDFPGGSDRQFKRRKSGWYEPEIILDQVFKAYIVWGLKPD